MSQINVPQVKTVSFDTTNHHTILSESRLSKVLLMFLCWFDLVFTYLLRFTAIFQTQLPGVVGPVGMFLCFHQMAMLLAGVCCLVVAAVFIARMINKRNVQRESLNQALNKVIARLRQERVGAANSCGDNDGKTGHEGFAIEFDVARCPSLKAKYSIIKADFFSDGKMLITGTKKVALWFDPKVSFAQFYNYLGISSYVYWIMFACYIVAEGTFAVTIPLRMFAVPFGAAAMPYVLAKLAAYINARSATAAHHAGPEFVVLDDDELLELAECFVHEVNSIRRDDNEVGDDSSNGAENQSLLGNFVRGRGDSANWWQVKGFAVSSSFCNSFLSVFIGIQFIAWLLNDFMAAANIVVTICPVLMPAITMMLICGLWAWGFVESHKNNWQQDIDKSKGYGFSIGVALGLSLCSLALSVVAPASALGVPALLGSLAWGLYKALQKNEELDRQAIVNQADKLFHDEQCVRSNSWDVFCHSIYDFFYHGMSGVFLIRLLFLAGTAPLLVSSSLLLTAPFSWSVVALMVGAGVAYGGLMACLRAQERRSEEVRFNAVIGAANSAQGAGAYGESRSSSGNSDQRDSDGGGGQGYLDSELRRRCNTNRLRQFN